MHFWFYLFSPTIYSFIVIIIPSFFDNSRLFFQDHKITAQSKRAKSPSGETVEQGKQNFSTNLECSLLVWEVKAHSEFC